MPLGGSNPLPFRIGGEQTPTQRTLASLSSAVGKGGTGPAGGLRELWRLCVARAIAQASDAKDLAALQAFPQTMSVALTAAERFFALPVAQTEVERRQNVVRAWTRAPDATGPNLGAELRAIDPAFALDSLPWSSSSTTIPGKAFGPGPSDPGPLFGVGQALGRYSAPWANSADSFTQRVRYYLAPGQTEIPQESLARAEALLNDVLPWWRDFDVYTQEDLGEGDGFYLDSSLLGAGAL